jgi:hypothetical protein
MLYHRIEKLLYSQGIFVYLLLSATKYNKLGKLRGLFELTVLVQVSGTVSGDGLLVGRALRWWRWCRALLGVR